MVDEEDGGGRASTSVPHGSRSTWWPGCNKAIPSTVAGHLHELCDVRSSAATTLLHRSCMERTELRRRHHLTGNPVAGSDQTPTPRRPRWPRRSACVPSRFRSRWVATTADTTDIYSGEFVPAATTIGTQVSPLTMANVYATLGANGVECTPIAITSVTGAARCEGAIRELPSASARKSHRPPHTPLKQGVVVSGRRGRHHAKCPPTAAQDLCEDRCRTRTR